MLLVVESDASSSIIHEYRDTSIFTNFDLWPSGCNPSKPTSRKMFTPCTNVDAWIYSPPFSLLWNSYFNDCVSVRKKVALLNFT